jgi:hypothetical protein
VRFAIQQEFNRPAWTRTEPFHQAGGSIGLHPRTLSLRWRDALRMPRSMRRSNERAWFRIQSSQPICQSLAIRWVENVKNRRCHWITDTFQSEKTGSRSSSINPADGYISGLLPSGPVDVANSSLYSLATAG